MSGERQVNVKSQSELDIGGCETGYVLGLTTIIIFILFNDMQSCQNKNFLETELTNFKSIQPGFDLWLAHTCPEPLSRLKKRQKMST